MADEKKPGIRISPAFILQIIALVGIVAGWAMSYATLRSDIKYLKEDVVKVEVKYNTMEATKLEWLDTVHKIELHLERIDTRQQAIEKKLGL